MWQDDFTLKDEPCEQRVKVVDRKTNRALVIYFILCLMMLCILYILVLLSVGMELQKYTQGEIANAFEC